MLQLKLEGKSATAKKRIERYGPWWTVVGRAVDIDDYDEKRMIYIKPSRIIKGEIKGLGSHWIEPDNDPHYKLLEVKTSEKGKTTRASAS